MASNILTAISNALKTPSASTITANTAKVANKTTTSSLGSNRNGVTSTVAASTPTTYTSQNVQNYLKGLNNSSANTNAKSQVATNNKLLKESNYGASTVKGTYDTNNLVDYYTNKGNNYLDAGNGDNAAGTYSYASRFTDDYTSTDDYKDLVNQYYTNKAADEAKAAADAQASAYSEELMKAFMEQNEASRQAMIDAIMQNLDAVKGTYKAQIQQIIDEYNDLVDQNEVKKDQERRRLRETQANRGQLDSGMGRQEMLDMNLGYDNITSDLNAARVAAVNEIYNLIAQAEAEANTNKANVNNNYNNALLEYQLANQ